ncbi:MAG: 23S rRNA (guanosine(2251)-2'-O)-methyltransferase RlmB [Bacteroidetes bacterium]|nr:23S rRNA (guanosine(2251)-2'-O)-methyltransferase RlmB [Bacteroidota bacterium]
MDDLQYIYGIRPVLESVQGGMDIQKIYLSRKVKGELITEIKKLAREREIGVQEVPEEVFRKFRGKIHQGVVALISPVIYQDIGKYLPQLFEKGIIPLVVVLDRITDVRNFGAIIRTAECMGAHAVVVPSKETAQINADAVKASAGALFRIPVCRASDLFIATRILKDSGLQIVSCSEKAGKTFYDVDFGLPTAILFGSEESGLLPALVKISDHHVKIPMAGHIASLNVSVAAGIVLFEAMRQREAMGEK